MHSSRSQVPKYGSSPKNVFRVSARQRSAIMAGHPLEALLGHTKHACALFVRHGKTLFDDETSILTVHAVLMASTVVPAKRQLRALSAYIYGFFLSSFFFRSCSLVFKATVNAPNDPSFVRSSVVVWSVCVDA